MHCILLTVSNAISQQLVTAWANDNYGKLKYSYHINTLPLRFGLG